MDPDIAAALGVEVTDTGTEAIDEDEGVDQQAAPASKPDAGAEARAAASKNLQMLARANERIRVKEVELEQRVTTARAEARKALLEELQSDDPDSVLAREGLDEARRRLVTKRMLLRHVPADKAPPELRQEVQEQGLRGEIAAARAEIQALREERKREREEAATAQQRGQIQTVVEAALSDKALPHLNFEYQDDRNYVLHRAERLGQEMFVSGEVNSSMGVEAIAKAIAKKLDEQFAEKTKKRAQASLPTAPPPAAAGQRRSTKNAGEVSSARTITAGATAATRPPPPREELTEDEFLEQKAAEFEKLEREGHFRRN